MRPNKQNEQDNQTQNTYPWHAHEWKEVVSLLGSSENGLPESEIEHRLQRYGHNKFGNAKTKSIFVRLIEQLRSPLSLVLVIAFVVTVALEEFIDAGVIAFALSIAVLVGIIQEGRASNAFKRLSDSQVHTATVIRSNQKHLINATELVPGDIVELQNGSQVPADLRITFSKNLSVNEAALTGEWLAVDKQAETVAVGADFSAQENMTWMGTFVSFGYGQGVVVATGDQTALGQVAGDLKSIEDTETPLQLEMQKISRFMLGIILALVSGIFVVGLLMGQSVHDMVLMSVAIAVASVPEGLPAAVTIILAVGMEALLKKGGLVRNLLAAETLGSTTYVLTDKTGTLTEAKMELSRIVHAGGMNAKATTWPSDTHIKKIIDTALCATTAYEDAGVDKVVFRGDALERAILQTAKEMRLLHNDDALRANRIDSLPFTSEQRYSVGLSEQEDKNVLCVNGVPEYLLSSADTIKSHDKIESLTAEKREELEHFLLKETKAGRRIIAVAYKEVKYDEISVEEESFDSLIKDITFLGFLVFDDPVRKGVERAIAGVQGAGAEVVLVTGDNPQTALTIAQTVGIAGASESAITGSDLDNMTDEDIHLALQNTHVFARVLPKQKLRLARLLQNRGETVAMTGDGINDAPALKRANIGVAVGSGTEVAKESSDLVLLDDSFSTIYSAIEEGRRIISNLRKIVGYLLSTSLSEVALIATALILGGPIPLLPAQILWANVIEEGLMSVAFAFEKGNKGAMKRRPQDIQEEGMLSKTMLQFILFTVVVLSSVLIVLYLYLQQIVTSTEELRSAMFLAISIDSLFIAFAFRSLSRPFWRIPLRDNLFFVGSFLASLAMLGVAVSVPFLQYVLSYTPLPLYDIFVIFIFGLISLLIVESGKWFFFRVSD